VYQRCPSRRCRATVAVAGSGAAAAEFFKELTRRGSGSGRFFKIYRGSGAAAVDFLKIHRGSGRLF